MSSSSFDEDSPLAYEYQTIRPKPHSSGYLAVSTLLLTLNALLLLVTLACIYSLQGGFSQSETPRTDCFDDTLLNPPIVWETRTFNSSVDDAKGTVTDQFSPTSPAVAAAWSSLLDVGEIRLSAEEASRLPKSTAHLYGGEEGYAGVLEVFHQLHCLNSIRKRFYNSSHPSLKDRDSPKLNQGHDQHCFEYLWQTLLCHADVSVMTLGWNEHQQAFDADFAVTKQCRNFDVIHDWAKNREAKFPPPGDKHPGRIEAAEGRH